MRFLRIGKRLLDKSNSKGEKMHITLNGEKSIIEPGISVSGLLAKLSLKAETTVAEVNGVIIKRGEYSNLALKDGDKVELVRFVGGG